MVRRYGTIVALSLLCLGLLGYLLVLDPAGQRGRRGQAGPRADGGQASGPGAGDLLGAGLIVQEKDKGNLVQLVIEQRVKGASPGLRSISLRRYEVDGRAQWWLDAPHLRADDAICEEVYAELTAAVVRRRLSGERRDAGRFGLSDDSYRLRLSLRQGHELRFGDDAPGDLIYAARDREPDVLVADRRLYDLLRGDREHFSSFLLTTREVDIAAAQRLQIGPLSLTRRPSSWEMSRPGAKPARARPERVEEALRTMRSARATRLLGGAPASGSSEGTVAAAKSSMVVKLDGIEQFLAGSRCPENAGSGTEQYVVRADSAMLCFAREDIARVTPSYARLREMRLLPFSPSEVRRLRLGPAASGDEDAPDGGEAREREGVTTVERQADGSFRVSGGEPGAEGKEGAGGTEGPEAKEGPEGKEARGEVADTEAVRAYLMELASLGAEDPARSGSADAGEGRRQEVETETGSSSETRHAGGRAVAGRLEIETEAGDRTVLKVVQGPQRGRALLRRDEEEPFLVPAAAVALLREGRLRFVSRVLQTFSPYKVGALTVERGASDATPETKKIVEKATRTGHAGPLGEGWRLRSPVEAPVDAELISRVLTELSDLRAERLVAAEAAPLHGLDLPAARFHISIEEPGGELRVDVGAWQKEAEGQGLASDPLDKGNGDRPGCYARTGASSRVALLPATTCDDLLHLLADTHPLLIDDARVREVGLQGAASPGKARTLVRGEFPAGLLDTLHGLGSAVIAGYGPPPSGPAELVVTVEQDEAKLKAAPTSSVAPEHQVLSVYPWPWPSPSPGSAQGSAQGGLMWLSGRDVSYRIPAALRQALRQSLRQGTRGSP